MDALDPHAWRLPAHAAGEVAGLAAGIAELVDAEGLAVPPAHEHLVHTFFGYRFRFGRRDGAPHEIDLSFRLEHGTPTVVRVVDARGERTRFLGPASRWVLQPLVDALVARVEGDELELDYTLAGRQPVLSGSSFVFPDGWWDAWKQRKLTDREGTVGDAYRVDLYPWFQRALRACEPAWRGRPLRVVDLCGGDGEALASLVSELGGPQDAVVVDRNAAALDDAAARGFRTVQHDVVGADLADLAGGPIDLLIASGALCVNVMRGEEAEAVADAVADAMAPGGVALVGGWTPCLIAAEGWRRRGLTVWNTVRPHAPGQWVGQQLYGIYKGRG